MAKDGQVVGQSIQPDINCLVCVLGYLDTPAQPVLRSTHRYFKLLFNKVCQHFVTHRDWLDGLLLLGPGDEQFFHRVIKLKHIVLFSDKVANFTTVRDGELAIFIF